MLFSSIALIGIESGIDLYKNKLDTLKNSNVFIYPKRMLERYEQDIVSRSATLCNAYERIIASKKESFVRSISSLDSLSPLKVLKRGYTFVENKEGKVIDSVKKLNTDDIISLKFADGKANCQVVSKEGNWWHYLKKI